MNLSPLAISYFFHLVATVVWIGGMMLLVLVIYPLQRKGGDWQPFVDAIEARFRPWSNLSLLVLLVTGVVQTGEDDNYGSLLDFSTPWSQAILAKHIAFFGMIGVVAFLQFGLGPALERARLLQKTSSGSDDLAALQQRERQLTVINLLLGIVVLIFTAMATAI